MTDFRSILVDRRNVHSSPRTPIADRAISRHESVDSNCVGQGLRPAEPVSRPVTGPCAQQLFDSPIHMFARVTALLWTTIKY